MRIKRVLAKNFRCLADVDLVLRDFTVIVGPNGAGKSSLLQVLRLFSELRGGKPDMPSKLAPLGGFHAVLNQMATHPQVKLGIDFKGPGQSMNYLMQLHAEGAGCFVEREVFESKQRGRLPETEGFDLKGEATAISSEDETTREPTSQLVRTGHTSSPFILQAKNHGVRSVDDFFDATERMTLWNSHLFSPSGPVRNPQQLLPMENPVNDGSNLLSVLYNLKIEREDIYKELVETFRVALPVFKSMEFPVVGAGHVYLKWAQTNLPRELNSTQLSDGTLRLLWLLTVLLTAPDDGVVMIDEPELSLHPQWLQLLVSVMRKTSARTTVIVATQSAEFLRWVEPNELLIADIDDGAARFTWADQRSGLPQWLADFTLSELWTMGELGGRR
jgi:predicted ATPase